MRLAPLTRSVIRRLRRIGPVALLVLLTALLIGAAAFRASETAGLAALRETGRHRLDLYAASLEREIDKYAFFPATLELERDVLDLAAGRPAPKADVNRFLERLNQRTGTLAIYVMNAQGRVVASSNWNRPDSFIGEDLFYRPYFIAAAAGRPGRFYGIGTTRNEPGYFLSSTLIDNGEIVGVAVVKVSLEQLERSWATVEAPVLVVDENGVAILASVPSWRYSTLRPLDGAERQRLERTLQYNARPLPPLGLAPVRQLSDDAELVRLPAEARTEADAASPFAISGLVLAQKAPLHGTPWSMTVLSPVAPVTAMAWAHAALSAVGSALVGMLALLWRQHRRHLRALRHANDALERKVEERTRHLRAAQGELVHAGKLAVIGQMSAGLAHELNQPLAALRTLSGNTVKFLQRGKLEAAQDNLERIGQLVDRMGALTGELKRFARKSTGAPQPVAVGRVIGNALFLLDARLNRTAVAVTVEAPDDAVALCDANRLEQVLVNLLTNALDALADAPDPAITIAASRQTDRVRVTVADNGPGLSDTARDRLFEPFFTTKDVGKDGGKETETGGGLGLGLAISAGIVRDFGGTLSGTNGPDGGALFAIDLPAAPDPAAPDPVIDTPNRANA
ncbi:sensor histidine kinase [Azospirillum griseum]|uniref:sensor histidine kinase n=1 Tax=Azospirillum griseum TaxID=2496639 RepID=UPI003634A0EE